MDSLQLSFLVTEDTISYSKNGRQAKSLSLTGNYTATEAELDTLALQLQNLYLNMENLFVTIKQRTTPDVA